MANRLRLMEVTGIAGKFLAGSKLYDSSAIVRGGNSTLLDVKEFWGYN